MVVRGTVYSADRVFVRTEGGVSMSTLRFITVVGETVYSASRVFVGSKDVSRLRLRSPTSSTTEEWLVSIVPVGVSYRYGVSGLRWKLLKPWSSEDVQRYQKTTDVTVSEFVQSSCLSCNEETKKSDSCVNGSDLNIFKVEHRTTNCA